MTYNLLFHIDAKKEFEKLDGSVRLLVLKQLNKIRKNPFQGLELGNKAGFDLTGYRKIYVNKKQLRIVYKIEEGKIEVLVVSINKRENMESYKLAYLRKK